MLLRHHKQRRRGVHAVEAAFIYPISFLLIIGMIVCGMGIFRYQETCHWARAGARWAVCHGGQWAFDQGQPLTQPSDVYNNAIQPYTIALNPANITYSVTWSDPGEMPIFPETNMPGPPFPWQINQVTVTVNYTWIPEAYLGGITFTATSTMPIEY
jgi:hypothetical protein